MYGSFISEENVPNRSTKELTAYAFYQACGRNYSLDTIKWALSEGRLKHRTFAGNALIPVSEVRDWPKREKAARNTLIEDESRGREFPLEHFLSL